MTDNSFWGRRAQTMAELAEVQSRIMQRKDIFASIAAYAPRPTDIIISPDAKCGTTLLQQTFHTLRTRGDFNFDDISRVVPWIETATSLGLDTNADQRAEPRGFKSHLSWDHVPKGAKYIVALRDPQDAFVSGLRFMEGWYIEPGTISFEEYFEPSTQSRDKGLDRWSHLVSWWSQRDNPAVLLLSYEHMVENPALMIRRVAAFCGISLDDELLALTLERTSRAFMLAHKDRFDDAMLRELSERLGGLPPNSDSAKVRPAGGARRRELPQEIRNAFDKIWRSDVQPKTGFADFAALDEELRSL